MHLDDEQFQRLLHGELVGAAADTTRGHLSDCATCQARLEEARREEVRIHTLLRRLDHAAPAVAAETLVARARGGTVAMPWRRWAAGILLTLAVAGAAYAAPGSPLPRWVREIARFVAGQGPAPTEPGAAGIAVQPSAQFTIEFRDSVQGRATVWVTDRLEVVVRSLDSAATFTTDVDRLIVGNRSPRADYEIELPSGAPWVEIRVGDRRLLLKEGPSVAAGVSPDDRGRYVLPLSP